MGCGDQGGTAGGIISVYARRIAARIAGAAASLLARGCGFGSDKIQGGAGDDILISGRTDFDHNALALRSVMKEWASSKDYQPRVHDLMNYQGMDGLNGSFFLNLSGAVDALLADGVVAAKGL